MALKDQNDLLERFLDPVLGVKGEAKTLLAFVGYKRELSERAFLVTEFDVKHVNDNDVIVIGLEKGSEKLFAWKNIDGVGSKTVRTSKTVRKWLNSVIADPFSEVVIYVVVSNVTYNEYQNMMTLRKVEYELLQKRESPRIDALLKIIDYRVQIKRLQEQVDKALDERDETKFKAAAKELRLFEESIPERVRDEVFNIKGVKRRVETSKH
ncbi:IDEAL domain-containing protein [Bacillus subtilis]|uniref:IDEAL domain-containing protein n=1 Tax=Bacillus subtilis TaxID=1423 RepID=UPI0025C89128|nr:IDEAL domain-containing protein [Bacillus subtilis]WCS67975.1 hypothetical protein Goe26_00630 [Bacillus phage vB_BsuM-Goe26]GLI90562.1 hypothetical protein ANABIO4_39140 [Bacillus subtilis]